MSRHEPRVATHDAARHSASMRFARRVAAVVLVVVAQGFVGGVPHAASTTLGIAYAASAVGLAVGAWRLWWPTMR